MRQVFDPIDVLAVDPVADPVLNHRLPAYAAGHDVLGFRNKDGLREAEILAVGDSMTYGISATADESWPAHLQELSGLEVYSAGIGGYGPLHYLHLVRRLLPEVKPDHVVIGIYLGNDLVDAYNLAYSNERWASYRREGGTEQVDPNIFIARPDKGKFLGGLRRWLAANSVLYRIVTQSSIFDGFRRNETLSRSEGIIEVQHLDQPMLLNSGRQAFTNPENPRILKGLEITKRALLEARREVEAAGASLLIAIVPVKEVVFLPLVTDQLTTEERAEMEALAKNVAWLQENLEAYLSDAGFRTVDLGAVLGNVLKTEVVYPVTDGHPNGKGYAELARAIGSALGVVK